MFQKNVVTIFNAIFDLYEITYSYTPLNDALDLR